ncbi:hypothetical protein NG796_14255 [Laspinema sp. A4]|uniref:hypothetical protein n=1 Tax=Laspinema sp. D2d TaxID=2953686 RepID=UPI0021BADBF6|nr:hypothetical protein [Laspinema sp. D2d]MCT7984460.1 hypothetical protein [Laspinema sp. D2d]
MHFQSKFSHLSFNGSLVLPVAAFLFPLPGFAQLSPTQVTFGPGSGLASSQEQPQILLLTENLQFAGSDKKLSEIETTSGNGFPETVADAANLGIASGETPPQILLLTEHLQSVTDSDEKLSENETTSGNGFPETVADAANLGIASGETPPQILLLTEHLQSATTSEETLSKIETTDPELGPIFPIASSVPGMFLSPESIQNLGLLETTRNFWNFDESSNISKLSDIKEPNIVATESATNVNFSVTTAEKLCKVGGFCPDRPGGDVMTTVVTNVAVLANNSLQIAPSSVSTNENTIEAQDVYPLKSAIWVENTELTRITDIVDRLTNVATVSSEELLNLEINLAEGETSQNSEFKTENPLSPIIAKSNPGSRGTGENLETATEAIAQSETGIGILSPTPGEILGVPATSVVVQFPEGTEIELLVNGNPVSPEAVGQTERDSNTGMVTQTWVGIPLQSGENAIAIRVVGATVNESLVTVFVSGGAAEIALETVEKRVPADGRSIVNIQGRLLDENGKLAQRDTEITLSASAGEFIGEDLNLELAGFQVSVIAGEFTAQLQSPLDAQTVRIRAATDTETIAGRSLEAFTQMQFDTYLRPSLVTGGINLRFGRRGLDYWGRLRDFLPPDENNEFKLDVTGAAFATGELGGWLFTGAYNSERSLNCDCSGNRPRLFSDTQFTEQNYPLYGDASTVQATAPSSDSVFLRFERSSAEENAGLDYFMWGNYGTSEFANESQQFTALTRALQGFKGNYNWGQWQVSALFANDVQGFQRDAIAPDGTSGFYFLSHRLVIPGSENLFLELEELGRPGNIVRRQQLNRGSDYEIDYDRGSILFRRPLLRTDVVTVNGVETVVARRIVATYQHEDLDGNTNLWGGRVRYNFSRDLNTPGWLGATYLRQNQGIRDFELYGADFMLTFGKAAPQEVTDYREEEVPNFKTPVSGQLIAEYAHSTNDSELLGLVTGEAYRLELNAIGGPFSSRLYYRTTDEGFANDATVSFVPGQTRYGALLNSRLTNTTLLQFAYDHEKNFGNSPRPISVLEDFLTPRQEPIPGSSLNNSLTTISAGLQQTIGRANVGLDWVWRNRKDEAVSSPLDATSSQLRSRFSMPITDTITIRAQNEFNLLKEEDVVYPDRTILGLDWRLVPGVTLELNQVWFTGGQYEDNSITSVNLNGDYNVTEDTIVTGRYSFINGQTMGAALGLQHGWTVFPGFRVNLAYEHVFGSLFSRTGSGSEFAQPYAPGQSAAALGILSGDSYSVGFDYTGNPDFAASARYEHRFSSSGNNTVISAAASGKLTDSLSVLTRYQQASSSNQLFDEMGDTVNLRMGLAYRNPNSDKFNALLRYDYRQNPALIPDSILFESGTRSRDHTFALETIYAPSWRWEFYGKTALRQSTSYLANDLAGTSLVSLNQLRATYRLAYGWDIMGEGRWIHQTNANYDEWGVVAEVGYYLTPDLRLGLGYVFGKVSDRDFNGDRSASGPYLGLTVKLNELWPGFGQVIPPAASEQTDIEATGGEAE